MPDILSLNNFCYFPKTNLFFIFFLIFQLFKIFFSFFFDIFYHLFQIFVKVCFFKFFFLVRKNNFLTINAMLFKLFVDVFK